MKNRCVALFLAALTVLQLCGCTSVDFDAEKEKSTEYVESTVTDDGDEENTGSILEKFGHKKITSIELKETETETDLENAEDNVERIEALAHEDIPLDFGKITKDYGCPYTAVNDGRPYFEIDGFTYDSCAYYSELDDLGRCSAAVAVLGSDIMPDEPRGEIGQIKPSGWHTVRYDDIIESKYLYNRCHLIGYQLAGDNSLEKNLITGTVYLNTEGMLGFENMVAQYIQATGNHVLYRVTPLFSGDNLVASGVLMEAESLEDAGTGLRFCVYCFNIQPGITIDYSTGESSRASDESSDSMSLSSSVSQQSADTASASDAASLGTASAGDPDVTYILNRNSNVIHYTWCKSVADMKEYNKIYFTGTLEEAVSAGYHACGICKPK